MSSDLMAKLRRAAEQAKNMEQVAAATSSKSSASTTRKPEEFCHKIIKVKPGSGVFVENSLGELHGYVPIEALLNDNNLPEVDRAYQRGVHDKKVQKMMEEYDKHAVKPILVNQRSDGSLKIIDGQQETAAILRLGKEFVWCRIVKGLSPKGEASLFYNANQQTVLSASQKFKSGVRAGRKDCVEPYGMLKKYGYDINTKANNDSKIIRACTSITGIYHKGGLYLLEQTLMLLNKAFATADGGVQAKAYREGQFIVGVSYLLNTSDEPANIITEALINRNPDAKKIFMDCFKATNGNRRKLPQTIANCLARLIKIPVPFPNDPLGD